MEQMEIFFSSFTLIKINTTLAPTNPSDCKEMSSSNQQLAELRCCCTYGLCDHGLFLRRAQMGYSKHTTQTAMLQPHLLLLLTWFQFHSTSDYEIFVYFHLRHSLFSSTVIPQCFLAASLLMAQVSLQRSLTKNCASFTDFSKHITPYCSRGINNPCHTSQPFGKLHYLPVKLFFSLFPKWSLVSVSHKYM